MHKLIFTMLLLLCAGSADRDEHRLVHRPAGGNTGSRRDRTVTVKSGTLDDIRALLAGRGPTFQVGPGRCRMW